MYGTLVEILHAAPVGDFVLPDGQPANCVHADCWVFEFLGKPKSVLIAGPLGVMTRMARFAQCQDKWLKPIRDPGEDARDETLEWLPVPSREEVSA
jgi:hypothetical protein